MQSQLKGVMLGEQVLTQQADDYRACIKFTRSSALIIEQHRKQIWE